MIKFRRRTYGRRRSSYRRWSASCCAQCSPSSPRWPPCSGSGSPGCLCHPPPHLLPRNTLQVQRRIWTDMAIAWSLTTLCSYRLSIGLAPLQPHVSPSDSRGLDLERGTWHVSQTQCKASWWWQYIDRNFCTPQVYCIQVPFTAVDDEKSVQEQWQVSGTDSSDQWRCSDPGGSVWQEADWGLY